MLNQPPTEYVNYRKYIERFLNHIIDNKDRLSIRPDALIELIILSVNFSVAFDNNSHEATKTNATRQIIKEAYSPLERKIRNIIQILKTRYTSALTENDYEILGIHRDQRTPTNAPITTIAPVNVLIKTKPLFAKIKSAEPSRADNWVSRLPDGVTGIQRGIAYTDTAIPPTHDQYKPLINTARTTYTITFRRDSMGKTAWLKTAFIYTNGSVGPTSEPLKIKVF